MLPTLLLLLLKVALLAAAAMDHDDGCPTKCGDVEIPYPFGIGAGCSRSKGFEISCVNNTAVLLSATHTIPVTSLAVAPEPVAKVNLPVAYTCYNSKGDIVGNFDGHVDINTRGAYRISDSRNVFVVLGCNTGAFTKNSNASATGGRYDYQFYMGCFTYCAGAGAAVDGRCSSVGCCHVDIVPGLTDNVVQFEQWPHDGMGYSPCDIAFLVDREGYKFRKADLLMDVRKRKMPVWLDWAIRDAMSCAAAAAENSTGYACVSAHSECVDAVNGPGYYCRCKQGYEGNPYQEKNGCNSEYLHLFFFKCKILLSC